VAKQCARALAIGLASFICLEQIESPALRIDQDLAEAHRTKINSGGRPGCGTRRCRWRAIATGTIGRRAAATCGESGGRETAAPDVARSRSGSRVLRLINCGLLDG
jgi:hypothetical protein